MVELRALGTLSVRAADGRELNALPAQPKRLALLAYLCLATPRGFHRRDKLLGLFWPESDEAHARGALRKALHVLRRAVGDEVILSRGEEEVGVHFAALSCDAIGFQDHIEHGRLEEAVALYRGDLLPGFFVSDVPEFEHWLERERARLRSLAARAAQRLTDQLESAGRLTDAVAAARTAMDLAGTDERLLRRLLELLDNIGDRVGAISAYEEFVRRVAEIAGVEPSAETQQLVRDIRSGRENSPSRIVSQHSRVEPQPVTSVRGTEPNSPPPVSATSRPTSRPRLRTPRGVIAAVILTMLAGAIAGTAALIRRATPRAPITVAVLPFKNLTPAGADSYFAETMHAELVSRLGMISGIRVKSRSSVLRYRRDTTPTRNIARELGADYILEGSVGRDSGQVHVVVRLIDARNEAQLWTHSYNYDRSVASLFELQADIARRLAGAVQVNIGATVRRRISDHPTESTGAYDLFLHASQLAFASDQGANTAAEELLRQALTLDPSFPAALAALAHVYQFRAYTLAGSRTWADSGLTLARLAVRSDSTLLAGYDALGFGHLELGHLGQSRVAYDKVVELQPSDGQALLVLGWIEFLQGRLAEAVTVWADALAVDPMNRTVLGDMGLVELLFGDFERAARWQSASKALPLRGGVGGLGRTRLLLLQGKASEAAANAERQSAESPRSFEARRIAAAAALTAGQFERARQHLEEIDRTSPDDWDFWGTTHRTSYAYVLYKLGDHERARALLDSTLVHAMRLIREGDERPGVRREIAAIHAARGDQEAAYQWLGEAIEAGWRHEALVPSPLFERLRAEPRFKALMQRMNAAIARERARVRRENLGPPLPPG